VKHLCYMLVLGVLVRPCDDFRGFSSQLDQSVGVCVLVDCLCWHVLVVCLGTFGGHRFECRSGAPLSLELFNLLS
jgi:hypothetical protein